MSLFWVLQPKAVLKNTHQLPISTHGALFFLTAPVANPCAAGRGLTPGWH